MSNYKKIEQMFRDYRPDKLRIKNIDRELRELDKEDGLSGVSYDGHGSSSEISDTTHSTVAIRLNKEKKLESERERLSRKINTVEEGLRLLNNTEQTIIIEYYMENKQWWEVGAKIGYSEAHCRRLRQQAINRVKKGIYGDNG